MTRVILVCSALAALTSCTREPDRYPPPLQRSIAAPFLDMKDRDGGLHMVSGIMPGLPQGAGWRWAYQHVELRYLLDTTAGWRFTMDLGLPQPNFRQTGPVTVTVRINGRELAAARFAAPGDHHFEEPVPPEWLKANGFNSVLMDANPPWVAPGDGAKLGFVLYRAGFVAK